ncbi:MAG: hypothetical protein IKC51_09015 [Myxococcaceae bacterium]|nr:hypothetical protein [Myxococcaceae bacterium]
MAELIDLRLMFETNRLIDRLLERRGLRWFLVAEGPRLFELEKSKLDLVVDAGTQALRRQGSEPDPRAIEHCRKLSRRRLIRLIAEAMLATGC